MVHLDRERWNRLYADRTEFPAPSDFLIEAFDKWIAPRFEKGGRALDLAGGRGQNAMFLAERGWEVTLVDVSDVAIDHARQQMQERNLVIDCHVAKAAESLARIEAASFDLVIVIFFLDRTLWEEIRRALRPKGLLLYKTYTTENLKFGHGPSNPDYLLRLGELREQFSDFEVLHSQEMHTDPATAELVALRR